MADERTYHKTAICVWVLWCALAAPGQEFSGGTGEPDDPYLIATAQDLIELGNTPEVYDKHFRQTADIDLSDHSFQRAVIAPDTDTSDWFAFQGVPFAGVFDGNDHVIHHLRIEGEGYLGLFGVLARGAVVRNLGLENSSIRGRDGVGSLAARNTGMVSHCYSTGMVTGDYLIGGLIAYNDGGHMADCHSVGEITPAWEMAGGLVGSNSGSLLSCSSTVAMSSADAFYLGGLVGHNSGNVSHCCSSGRITGYGTFVGGLIGRNFSGRVSNSYSAAVVTGWHFVGGLLGSSSVGFASSCYSTGAVTGLDTVGGLIGINRRGNSLSNCYSSGPVAGDENVGGLIGDNDGSVRHCFWDTQASGLTTSGAGMGLTTSQMQAMDTYLEVGWDFVGEHANGTAETWQMATMGGYPRLSLFEEHEPIRPQGQGTPAEPFLITNARELGAIGHRPFASYRLETDLDLSDIRWNVAPIRWFAGHLDGNGHVLRHLTIEGAGLLGLFGWLAGEATVADLGLEDASVQGTEDLIGVLAGENQALLTNCYSIATVAGDRDIGGLIGLNFGSVANCYHIGPVTGHSRAGGLVGTNSGSVSNCYSGALAYGTTEVEVTPGASSLLGSNSGRVANSFWDAGTSGVSTSINTGVGLTTAQMQDERTYLDAGWDFAAESSNGTAETWQMPETGGYPRLSVFEGYEPVRPEGQGTPAQPFLITNAQELGSIGHRPLASYRLAADIDLSGIRWTVAAIRWFGGHLDGNGHVIRGLSIEGTSQLGLFGSLIPGSAVTNLGLAGGSVRGTERFIGPLAGRNDGMLANCYSTSAVSGGTWGTGGLVGYNDRGRISDCHSGGTVTGGKWAVGGCVGGNWGVVSNCYSTATVSADHVASGLVGGDRYGSVANSFWDMETSGQARSSGGTGLTTGAMQDINTYLEAGWDFVGETDSGIKDLWWIDDGHDYPRLWWEGAEVEF